VGDLNNSPFIEIERKYLIELASIDRWCEQIFSLSPDNHHDISTHDTYWVGPDKNSVLRYRSARNLAQVTFKSLGGPIEVRNEVNVSLDPAVDDHKLKLMEFAKNLHFSYGGEISKQGRTFNFPDCEITCYTATCLAGEVSCIEIELRSIDDISHAPELFSYYEGIVGINRLTRSEKSLFEIFFEDGAK